MGTKPTNIVSYCTIIGWLVAYFAGDRENCKFHLNQGLILSGAGCALNIIGLILSFIPVVGWVFGLIINLVSLGVWALDIFALVQAARGIDWQCPVIDKITIIK